jgi:hypothetical protein
MTSATDAWPLFSQPWWLDAVAPGVWEAAEIRQSNAIIGRLPFMLGRRWGRTVLTHPPLCPTLGPWIRRGQGKYPTQLSEEHRVLRRLLEALPRFDLFVQQCVPEQHNILPFIWAGYTSSVRYTYRIMDLTDLNKVWCDFTESARRAIRKAERLLEVRDDLGVDDFYDVLLKGWGRQGLSVPWEPILISRVDRACKDRAAGKMLCAVDASGSVHAAVYIVWDGRVAYYLLGGGDPERRASGAHSLLIWTAIRYASQVAQIFDFEGSSKPEIERFFRSFGARQIPLFRLQWAGRRMRALLAAQSLGGALLDREVGPSPESLPPV